MSRIWKTGVGTLAAMVFFLTVLYPFCLYTNFAFVAKWRTIYIETAMSTLSHQWLATSFIPQDIIDDVLRRRYEMQELQEGVTSSWGAGGESVAERVAHMSGDQAKFYALFEELDPESFETFLMRNPDAAARGYLSINIDYCDKGKTGIVTTEGDAVLAVNAPEGILIVEVKKDDYNGRLAFVKDASRVSVGTCKALFGHGQFIRDIAARYDAVLAINASGFEDPDGNGNGGTPYGYLKSQGERLRGAEGGAYKIIGFDRENQLHVGNYSDYSFLRDAVEFQPALIVDGKQLVSDSAGLGIQPRTAIGQKADQTVMLLVVDGRQVGHSLGCTVNDCADILMRYGAVQAANLDGGSSSIMYYNGREITRPTTASKNEEGRYLPDAFIVQ